MTIATQNCMTEWSYVSAETYVAPSNEIELDAVFTDPDGQEKRVPAFWGGGNVWRVRYASPKLGRHRYRTECTDAGNRDLHGQEGELEVQPYQGDNPLLKHGPLRVCQSRRTLEHVDGTPFFWLGDTWWWGLVGDFRWSEEFQELVADRVRKGFNLIQIVVGHVPAMDEGDPRAGNEGGLAWSDDYRTINPAYFDLADLRINYLVSQGLLPCIFSMWGNWLLRLGVENVKRHWRYLVARYGAHPVVWSLCGEVQCIYPNFVSEDSDRAEMQEQLGEGWSEVCRYLGQMDPYRHPLTAHPAHLRESRLSLADDVPLTVSMLQTGHDFWSLGGMTELVTDARNREPRMPVINGECVYESILGSSWQDVQRFAIWSCVLSGAAGHTYGAAEGCWQIHHRGQPSFRFTSDVWGEYEDWRDIAAFPGSGQMQWCRRLLEHYEWWRFEPHPEWLATEDAGDRLRAGFAPRSAGIPATVRVIYLPPPSYSGWRRTAAVAGLEPNVPYHAFFFDPRSGDQHDLGPVVAQSGTWTSPHPPNMQDWVLVLETQEARVGG